MKINKVVFEHAAGALPLGSGSADYAQFSASLDDAIHRGEDTLLRRQDEDGSWCYELEADCTIPSEYILMMHFVDEVDETLERELAIYIRERQGDHGGWPLFHGGAINISCSVKAYYALKIVGDDPDEPHMRKAREAIPKIGEAARCNVFTRIMLAQFGQIPWRGIPFMPVELALLPRWFPFHLSKVSYWSRTVMVPLLILTSLRVTAINPRGVAVRELFTVDPVEEKNYFPVRSKLNMAIICFERIARRFERFIPGFLRKLAIKRAESWFVSRLNSENGLGAIFPAMVNAYEALVALGYSADHPLRRDARTALQKLVIHSGQNDYAGAYCQPCVSPVWDTALAVLALQETDSHAARDSSERALDWLVTRQVTDLRGDWSASKPRIPAGGWAFQYSNDYYPDLDDTAVVAWAMKQAGNPARYRFAIARAVNWIMGMRSANGGFASFDSDNTNRYLNEIPFADHGALLDPPTADVSARCLTLLSVAGYGKLAAEKDEVVDYLRNEQEADGSWLGAWEQITFTAHGRCWSVLKRRESIGMTRRSGARCSGWLQSNVRMVVGEKTTPVITAGILSKQQHPAPHSRRHGRCLG